MSVVCPCCQRELPGRLSLSEIAEFVYLSPGERVIFAILAKRIGQWVGTDRLIEALYGHDPDGGPEHQRKIVHIHNYHLRHKLKPYGLSIRGRAAGGHGGFGEGMTQMFWLNEEAS